MPFIKRHDTINIIQQFGTIYVPKTTLKLHKSVTDNYFAYICNREIVCIIQSESLCGRLLPTMFNSAFDDFSV